MHLRLPIVLAMLLALGFGCSSPPIDETDTGQVKNAVYDMADAASDPDRFETLFVDGAAPDDATRQKYAGLSYNPIGEPTISGDEATITVEFIREDETPVGTQQEWKVKKVGDTWKLSEAPLPPEA